SPAATCAGTRSPLATAGNRWRPGWNSTPPSVGATILLPPATDCHEPGTARSRPRRLLRRRGAVAAADAARRPARLCRARARPGAARGAGPAQRAEGDGTGAVAAGTRSRRTHAAAVAGAAVGAAAAPPGAGAGCPPGRLRPARDRAAVRRAARGAGLRQRLLPGALRRGARAGRNPQRRGRRLLGLRRAPGPTRLGRRPARGLPRRSGHAAAGVVLHSAVDRRQRLLAGAGRRAAAQQPGDGRTGVEHPPGRRALRITAVRPRPAQG